MVHIPWSYHTITTLNQKFFVSYLTPRNQRCLQNNTLVQQQYTDTLRSLKTVYQLSTECVPTIYQIIWYVVNAACTPTTNRVDNRVDLVTKLLHCRYTHDKDYTNNTWFCHAPAYSIINIKTQELNYSLMENYTNVQYKTNSIILLWAN